MKNIKKYIFISLILCLTLGFVSLFGVFQSKSEQLFANNDNLTTSIDNFDNNLSPKNIKKGIYDAPDYLPQNWLNIITQKQGVNMNLVSTINFIYSDEEITESNEIVEGVGFNYDSDEKVIDIYSKYVIISPESMNDFIPENYSKLKELNFDYFTLNEEVTSLSNIISKNSNQQYLVKLKIVFGDYFDTSNVVDMSKMFVHNIKLSEVYFGEKFNTENVTDMSYMFYNCRNLTEVNLSNFDTSNVENMCCMFCNCSSLLKLDLSNFDTSKVTNMHSMFNYCYALEELNIDSFSTSNVVDMSYMFYGIGGLKTINVSHFDTSNVENMCSMFGWMENLEELDVSNFDTSSTTDISWMFSDLYKITSIDVSNFDTSNVVDMSGLFNSCYNIEEIDTSMFDTSNVESIESMFAAMTKIKNLDITNFDLSNCLYMCEAFAYCDELEFINLEGIDTSLIEDFSFLFSDDYSLKTVKGLENLDTSSAYNISSMFCNTFSLESLDLSKWDVRNVKYLSYMFDMSYITELEDYDSISLKYLNLSGWQLNSIEDNQWSHCDVFSGCNTLETIILPFYKGQFNIELPYEFYVVDMLDLTNQSNTTNVLLDYTPNGNILQKVGTDYVVEIPKNEIDGAEYIHKNSIYIIIEAATVLGAIISVVGAGFVIQRIKKHEK